jgi:hypothetical protein
MQNQDIPAPAAPSESAAGRAASPRIPEGQRLVAVFALGALLLNFPLLALWDVRATVMGIPVFPVALFGLWALLIGLVGWMADRKEP